MSNLTYIKTRIRNREHLIMALKNLGFTIKEGSSLTISNNYETRQVELIGYDPISRREIGFFQSNEGDYTIAGGGLSGMNSSAIEKEVLKIENQIKREYARNIVKKKLADHGFFLESEDETNDRIVIKLSRIV